MFVGVMILYNEKEFVEDNIRQHIKYLDRLIVIDGGDKRNGYVSKTGLSDDGTAKVLRSLRKEYGEKIELYEMPFATKEEKARFYLSKLQPGDWFIRIDADEFYTFEDLRYLRKLVKQNASSHMIIFPIWNFWKDIKGVIQGRMFDVPHCKVFKVVAGCSFAFDHVRLNLPDGRFYMQEPGRVLKTQDIICFHMGFARADIQRYKDNLAFYINKGEDRLRPDYIECRKALINNKMPDKCKVQAYEGYYPEIFYLRYKGFFFEKGS